MSLHLSILTTRFRYFFEKSTFLRGGAPLTYVCRTFNGINFFLKQKIIRYDSANIHSYVFLKLKEVVEFI